MRCGCLRRRVRDEGARRQDGSRHEERAIPSSVASSQSKLIQETEPSRSVGNRNKEPFHDPRRSGDTAGRAMPPRARSAAGCARPSLAPLHAHGRLCRRDVPIIVRGEHCHLEDANGKRYLDALASLFAVKIGYSHGEEMGQAALAQMRELPSTRTGRTPIRARSSSRTRSRRSRRATWRVFFVSGGSEAVSRPGSSRGVPRGSRRAALEGRRAPAPYHGDDGRALDQQDRRAADAVRAARPRRDPRQEHESLPPPSRRDRAEFTAFLLEDMESAIEQAGPGTVAMVILEPVQNAGGSFSGRVLRGRPRICAGTASSSAPTR